jgi:hypothetical protein
MSQLNVNNITKYTGGEVVVNDASEDVDFRVESNDEANMLVVDAGNNGVGIGVAAPSAKLEIEDGGTSLGNTLLKVTLDDQSSHYGLSVGNDSYDTADEKGLILQQANDGTGQILVNTAGGIYIDTAGIVTKPSQPAFFGTSGRVLNCTGDGTELICTPVEVTDRNGDFSGTDFTAPVTGLYLITFNCFLGGLTAAMTSGRGYIDTSNRGIYNNVDWGAVASSGTSYGMAQTVITDLDASDVVRFKVMADGGAKVADFEDVATFGVWLLG